MTSVLSTDSMQTVPAPMSVQGSAPVPPTNAAPVPPSPAPATIPTVSASKTPSTSAPAPPARSKPNKVHVPSACINCKKAHLACDISRPCKRCISVGKDDTCRDVEHKKRGRPKLVDKQVEIDSSAWGPQGKEPILSTAAAMSKNRAKGKYTKSANYKASRRGGTNVPPASNTASPNGTSMQGATGPHNPIHTPSTATPSPDTTSRTSTLHHDASTTSVSPPSYVDRTHHTQYARQDYSQIHPYPSSYDQRSGRPLDSPVREDKDPFYAHSHYGQPVTPQSPVVTLFLSVDLLCARASDESQTMWGYHPHDISNKSLRSIISSEDQGKVSHLQRVLKDALFAAVNPTDPRHLSQFPFIESTSPVFYQNRPGIMSSIAPGSTEVTDVVRVCYSNGGSDLYTMRVYIGGGLGTDLVRRMNIEHAYLVCVMTRYVNQRQQHQHQPHHYQQHQQAHPHHMTPRSSLDEPERIPPPVRTASHSSSRPSSLYLDDRSAAYATEGSRAYNDSNGSHMASSRISLPSLPNVFSSSPATSTALPSPRDSMPVNSPLTPNPTSEPVSMPSSSSAISASSLASSSSSSSSATATSVLAQTVSSASSTSTLHMTSRPASSLNSSYSSSSLPLLHTEPLHKARWLYEPGPIGGARDSPYSSQNSGTPNGHGVSSSSSGMGGDSSSNHHLYNNNSNTYGQGNSNSNSHHSSHQGSNRLPSLLSDPFGSFSAPMGGFGVSKYLSRAEPTPSFAPPTGRHMLPLPGSLPQQQSSSSATPARSLQRDLSSTPYGATFATQPPPAISSALKRPLADMADRQDHTRDIDSRHNDYGHHHQQQQQHSLATSSPSTSSSLSSSSIPPSSTSPTITSSNITESTTTSRTIALDLQVMPPDHPPVDMSKGAVCPIVHGERMKQQQQQPQPQQQPPVHAYSTPDSEAHSKIGPPSAACPWSIKSSQRNWSSKMNSMETDNDDSSRRRSSLEDHHHPNSSSSSPSNSNGGSGLSNGGATSGRNGGASTPYSGGSPPPSPHHHPYRPTSSTYTYPSQSHHRRSSGTITRPGAIGSSGSGSNGSTVGNHRYNFGSSSSPLHHCLSGACGVICRCHIEDEETRAAKAMEAARKRMSVHSLLC
ncbi:hypothetical protein BGW42_003760 [Actinomortierella wolfii]|nr:hypothetical protein BGW42_003760 [Actinomortierella wolfii]